MRIQVDGRELVLSNLDKVLWPKTGFTKADLIDYYRRIAPVLLPHLRGRALTLKRYPDGVEGHFFYEKSCPSHAPPWVHRAPIFSETRGEDIEFCVIDDLPSLVWAANLADIEMHTYLAHAKRPRIPLSMVFDLDPGPGTNIVQAAQVALDLSEMLVDLGLQSFAKTSGSKGMQLYVPLHTPTTYDETKPLARALGEILERERPDAITTNMSKAERPGRIFIDWSQNDAHKTTVCVYSLRAKDEPTVSTPLTWDEVRAVAEGDEAAARFGPDDVLARVERLGDLFLPVVELEQSLPLLA